MMKKLFSNRLALPTIVVASILVSTLLTRSSINKGFDFKRLLAGVQTCSNRTNQTFTASMINETSSGFVNEEFVNLTDECLAELNSLALKNEVLSGEIKDNINELTEKTHWFHQKVLKILGAANESSESFNTFDIASRYEVLDLLRTNALNSLEALEASNTSQTNTYLMINLILGLIGVFILGSLFVKRFYLESQVARIEANANDIITNSNMMVATADKVFFDYFKLVDLPGMKGLFSRYSEEILSIAGNGSSINQKDHKVLKLKEEVSKTRPNFDLSQTLESNVESLQKQAFKHKVRVDASWDENLNVVGTVERSMEGINLLFKDLLEKSHIHQMERRLTLRTRVLGGTTYLRVSIKDYCFNTSYLDFENSLSSKSTDLSTNIVKAYKILNQESARIVFKNGLDEHGKISNAVVEVLFETARPEEIKDRATTRIVRGTKASVLGSIANN